MAAFSVAAQPTNPPAVPPPPAARADRFGIYNWGTDFAAYPGDNNGQRDRLNWAADQVAAMGSRTIRIFIGPRDVYFVNPVPAQSGTFDLIETASSPAYDKLFRDPRFKTYFLTTYTDKGFASDWMDGYTDQEYQAERDKIRRFGEYLLGNPNYAGKTFILINWEGDNAIGGVANKQSVWDYYTRWTQARADGVNDARLAKPTEAGRLFSGLEFNSIEFPDGKPCGSPVADPVKENPLKNRCVIDYVAPRVTVDYYSYSSWHTVARKQLNPSISLKKLLKDDLAFALGRVRAARPSVEEKNFVAGEAGFARVRFGECLAARNTGELFDALEGADAFKASYAIYWQVIDNAPVWDNDVLGLHGLYRTRNGQLDLTLAGKVWQAKTAGQEFPVPNDCPRIRETPTAGVVNLQNETHDFSLYPDSAMKIYAQDATTPFSTTGNKVTLIQDYAFHQLPRDNAQGFTESASQLTVSLPPARNPGWGSAYITDQRGIDSNGQILYLGCETCPILRNRYPVLDAETLTAGFYPNAVSVIFGSRFSASGNTVTIEQFDKLQQMRAWTASRTDAWTETPTRITVRLPGDLLQDRPAYVYVTDAQGKKSNRTVIYISARCSACGPGLGAIDPILNHVTRKDDFHPGTQFVLRGQGFSATGNQVIVEQGGKRFVVARDAVWSESVSQITGALPAALQPGYAIIYLIDGNGRETTAIELNITSTTVASVSAASYSATSMATEAIVAAFGTALATTTTASTAIPLPTELSGTKVIIRDSAGVERNAPLFFVSPSQVNYQIPPQTSSGRATVTIISGDGSISTGTARIEVVAPGVFTANASGSGLAAALVLRVKADGTQVYEPVTQYDAAQQKFVAVPIDLSNESETPYLVLFGTGWRFRSAPATVTVSVDGSNVPVEFAGSQGTLIGLDQINVRLPRTLSGRGQVNILVTVDGQATNQSVVIFK